MSQGNRTYFLQRAAEELAAAERATGADASAAHREMSLRYALKLILPEADGDNDDARVIGLPRDMPQPPAPAPSKRRSAASARRDRPGRQAARKSS